MSLPFYFPVADGRDTGHGKKSWRGVFTHQQQPGMYPPVWQVVFFTVNNANLTAHKRLH